ncbi:hypothetical protein CEH05_04510 [Halobacillus halophilus]|uniref:Lipocalin-like domain-containing protein n=1 Tax=Halobacillus halophilus (strain ATCC 35676 / DSM 2266 / JCM 20832 / KCTC 3685 / LMG 17431 / NBRC 102448 / NCIMB 2269) TaxID=866895 RepID=I0JJE4_HALH3|nr:lipocalin-like domain-containing protein [Halobacillus halophilus]ASF38419.1 hypothetical protein CEH05_04510 [Halobacillus halophilus]CCG44262.1 conserved hypothetical protein [Halobacillus halophilus DSM 2266]
MNEAERTLKEKLTGVWKLVNYQVTDSRGVSNHPMGKDASGIAIYHEDGYMSVQIMSSRRLAYAAGGIHTGPTKAVAAAAKGYLAYSGTYEIDSGKSMVEHYMTVSLNPNWEGDTQPRYVQFEGDRLIINSQPVFIQGQEKNTQLIWERADSSSKNEG